MTLAASRIVFQGETPYAHEREAIDFAVQALPNTDPYHLWALLELLDPSTGRLYELDMIVLGYSALYLVEIKSGPGTYEGDYQDWYRTPPGDTRQRYLENPLRLTNHKAKVLASLLERKMKRRPPWIEPLVFLSAADLDVRLRNHGDQHVVTRNTLAQAIQHHQFPGADDRQRPRIDKRVAQEIAAAMKAIGLKKRAGKLHAGAYELGDVIEDGAGYQDRLAQHRQQSSITCRARTYLVPAQTSVERRQQLRRAADRESQLLWDVREHENILRIAGYETDAPLGPTVLFDPFAEGVPLSTFVRQHPDLPFVDRVAIVEQVGRALAYCHRRKVFHAALSPEAVLVRRHPDSNEIETRLFNFQLAQGTNVEATSHWSSFAPEPWAIYQAPELREDPSQRNATADVFSLGALAYFVFTGRAPAEDLIEAARRLHQEGCYDPRAVADGIQDRLAELIREGTRTSPVERIDDAQDWVEFMLDEITRPEPEVAPPEPDPLDAKKEDLLGEFLVEAILGQGATSRVLQVLRGSDNRSYALKVPLSDEHAQRLEEEAKVLERLHHARVVQLVDRVELAGRTCLLLSLAGERTLHRHLAKEGALSLEHAERYGEDLLSALEYLEEQDVPHRDIKPANLGVGSVSKSRAHLTLFDFSLAKAAATDIQVGTAAYRDPFLALRGAWDRAAERWSAAVTLHEMLTGKRAGYAGVAIDADSKLELAAEAFDPSVREGLVAFFERALHRDIERRFEDAGQMRRAWLAALDAERRPAAEAAVEEETISEDILVDITPDTVIEALPLTPRARNALDRAGLLHAKDLLDLPDNRLSAIRGIGHEVAKEILVFRDQWRGALESESAPAPKSFFAGYRGEDVLVETAGLESAAARALDDAGLGTLAAVASAPQHQVEALAKRHGFDVAALKKLLDDENARANAREYPSTVEGWLDALLPKRRKSAKHVFTLLGLSGAFEGRVGVSAREVADAEGISRAAVYIALSKLRDFWMKHGAVSELAAQVHEVVEVAGGALPLEDAAQRLLAVLPHDAAADERLRTARAAALFRIVVEVEKAREDALPLEYVRLGGRPWITASSAHTRAVRSLGAAADRLAAREVLAGQGETARVLAETAAGTPLQSASPQRLAELAADASETAARSSRLELYPRDMPPERALALSASLLKSQLEPAEVVRRVTLRYPDARPLPTRPDLDALLKPHGLRFDETIGRYVRPDDTERTVLHTRLSSLGIPRNRLPSQAVSMEPDAVVARQFDERLRNAVERRHLRVLGVRVDRAQEAARAIARRLDVPPVVFDDRLLAAIDDRMANGGITSDAIVHDADRLGPTGPAWLNLTKLVTAAADDVAAALLPPTRPLLLVQPGLIARYRLEPFLLRLVEAAKSPDAAAILLLVPSHDVGGIPRINGAMTIPGLLPSQALWIPPEWLREQRGAEATQG